MKYTKWVESTYSFKKNMIKKSEPMKNNFLFFSLQNKFYKQNKEYFKEFYEFFIKKYYFFRKKIKNYIWLWKW